MALRFRDDGFVGRRMDPQCREGDGAGFARF
jgi:hypothetical protein